jgi:DNA-binding IclR family transcriptional regulator
MSTRDSEPSEYVDPSGSAQRYRTVARVIEALEVFADARRPLRLTELARELRVPVSSTQALVRELERTGVLAMSDGKEYSVGPRLVALAVRLMRGLDVLEHARGPMVKLAEETGEYVYLAIPDGDNILYADRVEVRMPQPRVDIPLGVARPLYATAAGQVYLASHSPEGVRKIFERIPFTQETTKTIVDRDELEARITKIREQGYAVTREEAIVGVVGTAAMIRNAVGQFAGALTISVLSGKRVLDEGEAIRCLLATCDEISRSLGWTGAPLGGKSDARSCLERAR